MKAQIIIERGQARLQTPVYLKPTAPKHYEVEIPDDAIDDLRDWVPDEFTDVNVSPIKPLAQPGSLQEELNALLGGLAKQRMSASIGDDHQTLTEAVEARYFGS